MKELNILEVQQISGFGVFQSVFHSSLGGFTLTYVALLNIGDYSQETFATFWALSTIAILSPLLLLL